jgi:hypothetical protein
MDGPKTATGIQALADFVSCIPRLLSFGRIGP